MMLSVKSTATKLNVCTKTVRSLRQSGHLKGTMIGRKLLFEEKEVDAFLERQRDDRRPHRYVLTDEEMERFQVQHADRLPTKGQPARPGDCSRRTGKVYHLGPRTANCNDRPLVLSESQFELLKELVKAGGAFIWSGEDLGMSQSLQLAKAIEWVEALLLLVRQRRGLRVEIRRPL